MLGSSFKSRMARKRDSEVSSLAEDAEITSNNLKVASTIQDSPHNLARAAVQAMERNVHSRKSSSTRQSGFLESIELVDFMCHRNFRMNFSPLINFIYGNNGSGKSAILTAITVALGGRANVTQRGTSFESLIREGATCAKVKIKLNNQGDNPYQPELYGEHIIVERTFRREGASTYAIHACNGRVIATRKDEMNAICDHFAIQVDNPLVVLTQEVAKRFLASSNTKDLYAVSRHL